MYVHTHSHTYLQSFGFLPPRQHSQSGSFVRRDRLTFTATGLLGHSGRQGGRKKGEKEFGCQMSKDIKMFNVELYLKKM